MNTWWLKGKEGWELPFPTPGTVDGPSHGINLENIKKVQSSVGIYIQLLGQQNLGKK